MKKLLCLLLIALTLLLAGCQERASPAEYLSAFSSAYPMPPGRYYDSEAGEESDAYLPPAVFDALFVRSPGDDDREDLGRFALFLGTSLDEVYEMGIFECPDRDCAREVMGCLETRLALLRREERADAGAAKDANLLLFGRTVVYTVLPDNAKAARILERLF